MTKYLIDFKDDAPYEAIQEYLTTHQCTVIGKFDKLNKVYHVESAVLPPSVESIVELVQNDEETVLKLLEVLPLYTYPAINSTTTITNSDEKNWWKIYSYSQVDLANDTTAIPNFGEGTNIYLVDSGIDASHPEFTGKDVSLLYSMTPGDFDDYTGHGTSLASAMIGATCGILNASLKVVKIFSNDPKTNPTKQSDILYALDAILKDAAFSTNLFSVVNLSWTISKNEYIEDKIRHLIDAGIAVVAAAGNSGHPIEQVTPASMPEVITVGAYQADFLPCDFSDYTDPSNTSLTKNLVNTGALDVWAPGENIYTATSSKLGGGYGFTSGTSIAAAIESASISFNMAQSIYGQQSATYHLDVNGQPRADFLIGFSRQGLLDLSDPKYMTSVNGICTFENREIFDKSKSKYTGKLYDTLLTPQKMVVRVNQKSIGAIGNPLINNYELKSALPDGLAFENRWVIASFKNEPASGPNGVETFEIHYTLYPEDTTVDPIDSSIMIVLLGSTFDQATLPEDDPILDLLALSVCAPNFFGNCSARSCPTGFECQSDVKTCICSKIY